MNDRRIFEQALSVTVRTEDLPVTDRRIFVSAVAALAVVSQLPAQAQQARNGPLVVWLGINPPDPGETELTIDLFRDGLRDLGYVDGKNIVVEELVTPSSVNANCVFAFGAKMRAIGRGLPMVMPRVRQSRREVIE